MYCPFLHKDETIDPSLERMLGKLKAEMSRSEGLAKSNPITDKKSFQDKLLKIMMLRSCKSVDDLYQKEMNALTKDQENTLFDAKAPESS